MERTLTHTGIATDPTPVRALAWRRVLPLWRHAVWLVALFSVLAVAAAVRLDVQQLRKDLDRNARATREARILNDRLRLEMDARRRAVAMEAVAAGLDLGPQARIERLAPAERLARVTE